MTNTKQDDTTDDIDYIDPVAPRDQQEEQDPFFSQMGNDANAKFVEQEEDDDQPVGSPDGEYDDDDENAEENPPKETILHEVSEDDEDT